MGRICGAGAMAPMLVAWLMAAAGGARADEPVLVIDGAVRQAQHVTAAALRSLPPVREEIAFETDHGAQKATYTGVLLWDLVQRAGIDDTGKWSELRHVLQVTGKDGYRIMLSVGEIDPNFGHAPMLVAYARNGVPLAGDALRLVVPGDRHGARSVRDLVHIEIR